MEHEENNGIQMMLNVEKVVSFTKTLEEDQIWKRTS